MDTHSHSESLTILSNSLASLIKNLTRVSFLCQYALNESARLLLCKCFTSRISANWKVSKYLNSLDISSEHSCSWDYPDREKEIDRWTGHAEMTMQGQTAECRIYPLQFGGNCLHIFNHATGLPQYMASSELVCPCVGLHTMFFKAAQRFRICMLPILLLARLYRIKVLQSDFDLVCVCRQSGQKDTQNC